jgi:hypothetical protein
MPTTSVRFRRPESLKANGITKKSSDDAIIELLSNDEESLETLHDKANATNEASSDPLAVWGVPLQSVILLNIAAIIWGTQHAVIKSVVDNISIGPDAAVKEWLRGLVGFHEATILNDGDSAAYFTLARFGLAALLASPYTPGLNVLLDNIRSRMGVNSVDGVEDRLSQTRHESSLSMTQYESSTIDDGTNLSWRYGLELGVYMFLGYAFQAIGLEITTASRSGFLLCKSKGSLLNYINLDRIHFSLLHFLLVNRFECQTRTILFFFAIWQTNTDKHLGFSYSGVLWDCAINT